MSNPWITNCCRTWLFTNDQGFVDFLTNEFKAGQGMACWAPEMLLRPRTLTSPHPCRPSKRLDWRWEEELPWWTYTFFNWFPDSVLGVLAATRAPASPGHQTSCREDVRCYKSLWVCLPIQEGAVQGFRCRSPHHREPSCGGLDTEGLQEISLDRNKHA